MLAVLWKILSVGCGLVSLSSLMKAMNTYAAWRGQGRMTWAAVGIPLLAAAGFAALSVWLW